MNGQLLVELNDLRTAERELSQLLVRLQADEQEARALYKRLEDWKGQSADHVRQQIEAFLQVCRAAYNPLRSRSGVYCSILRP